MIFCCINASALILKGTDVYFSKSGDQMPVDIIAENAVNGISHYNISIKVDSPDIATVSRLFFPLWAENRLRTELPSPEVWMSADDTGNIIEKGTAHTRLGMVMLSSLGAGETGITLNVNSLVDDDNTELSGSGANDLLLSLVPNKTITLAAPSLTQTSMVSVTPLLTPEVSATTGTRINSFKSQNVSALNYSFTSTITPASSSGYAITFTASEFPQYVSPTTPYYSFSTPEVTKTLSYHVQITEVTQKSEGTDIFGLNSLPFIISGILLIIAFALLIRW